jgi:hypothetical protein
MNYTAQEILTGNQIQNEWAEHMACICENKMCIGFWCGKLNIGGNLEDVAVDRRIILNWILKKKV